MKLRQVVHTVRAHWVVALVTFLVCIFIGGAYAVVPAKQYTASVVLVAQPPLVPLTRVPTSGHSDRDSPDHRGSGELDDRRRGPSQRARTLPLGAGGHQRCRGPGVEHGHHQSVEH